MRLSDLSNHRLVRPHCTKSTGTQCQTMDGVMQLINKLLMADWGDSWGTFSNYEPIKTDPTTVDLPQIYMHVLRRTNGFWSNSSGKQVKQLRPTFMESLPDPQDDRMWRKVYRKDYTNIVAFDVYASTQRDVFILSTNFMDFIDNYEGVLLESGLGDLTFDTEDEWNVKDNIPCRRIIYLFNLQRITTKRVGSIKDLTIETGTSCDNIETEYSEDLGYMVLKTSITGEFLEEDHRMIFDTHIVNPKDSEITD